MHTSKRRQRRRRGFTLIELIVVIVIIGVLGAIVVPRVLNNIGDSRQGAAAASANALASQMRIFLAKHGGDIAGESPTIDVLWERPSYIAESSYTPYVQKADDLLDPWGNKFVLVIPGEVNLDFDIVSYGADGEPGGEGENADIVVP